jgi:hypothetical protein
VVRIVRRPAEVSPLQRPPDWELSQHDESARTSRSRRTSHPSAKRESIRSLDGVTVRLRLPVSNGMDAPTFDGINVPEWKCQ